MVRSYYTQTSMFRCRPDLRREARSWARVKRAAVCGSGATSRTRTGLPGVQAHAADGERRKGGRVVLLEVRTQLVVELGAVPHRVLLVRARTAIGAREG
jgi:hypothetical protein